MVDLFDPYDEEDDDFYLDEDEGWEDEGEPYFPTPLPPSPLEDEEELQE